MSVTDSDLIYCFGLEAEMMAVMVLTSSCTVCASLSIREAVTKTVQPRAGRNLRLMIFEPDTFHARGEDQDLPDSIQSTTGDRQDPPPTVTGEDKQIDQVRRFRADRKGPQSSLSEEVNTQTGSVQMGNHAK